jgi:DNA-binding HxlR family transcriptional regulator
MKKTTSTNFENKVWLDNSCGLSSAFNLLSGRWKLNIIWKIREGANRYSSLKLAIPGITEKVLYERLKELEHDGLIDRQNLQLDKPHVEYSLTHIAYKLIPILLDLWEWGDLIKKDNPHTAN